MAPAARARQSHGAGGAWQGAGVAAELRGSALEGASVPGQERLMVAQARCTRSSMNKKRLVQSVFLYFIIVFYYVQDHDSLLCMAAYFFIFV
jgi:hypothetical protein